MEFLYLFGMVMLVMLGYLIKLISKSDKKFIYSILAFLLFIVTIIVFIKGYEVDKFKTDTKVYNKLNCDSYIVLNKECKDYNYMHENDDLLIDKK